MAGRRNRPRSRVVDTHDTVYPEFIDDYVESYIEALRTRGVRGELSGMPSQPAPAEFNYALDPGPHHWLAATVQWHLERPRGHDRPVELDEPPVHRSLDWWLRHVSDIWRDDCKFPVHFTPGELRDQLAADGACAGTLLGRNHKDGSSWVWDGDPFHYVLSVGRHATDAGYRRLTAELPPVLLMLAPDGGVGAIHLAANFFTTMRAARPDVRPGLPFALDEVHISDPEGIMLLTPAHHERLGAADGTSELPYRVMPLPNGVNGGPKLSSYRRLKIEQPPAAEPGFDAPEGATL